jgi:hypothetical protein
MAAEDRDDACWLSRTLDLLASMVSIPFVLSLAFRTSEFVFYHLLLSLVDRVSACRAT